MPGFRNRFGGSNFVSHDGRRFDRFNHDGFRFRGFPSYGYPLYGPYVGYVPLWDSGYYDAPQEQVQQQYDPVVRADVNIHDDRAAQPAPEQLTQQASVKQPDPPAAEQDPTVLVFRDGHKLEVRNYAIVGPTLFNFDGHSARKIPLSDLDLDTTRKLNDDRGNEFHVPGQ